MYNVVSPYFPKKDVDAMLVKFRRILEHGPLTMGENVKEFESGMAKYVGAKHAVATNSCTSAMEIVLRAIGVKKGDEVIVPTQTFIATATAAAINGATPVFAEVDDNFLLDVADLKKKITKKTKAVIIVHFAGLIHPEIFEIKTFLKKKKIFLIEDCAHANGATIAGVQAGNIGDFGCFSFYSTKIITTGEGGMITVNDDKYAALCRSLRSRGVDVNAGKEIYVNVGSNRRLTEFQAVLGNSQLNRLEEFVVHRNHIAGIYKTVLKPLVEKGLIRFQTYPKNSRHAYWRFIVVLEKAKIEREELQGKLAQAEIKIDYPYEPLLHKQPVFNEYKIKSLKRTEELCRRHFCLPMHLLIRETDARIIAEKVKGLIK